MTEEMFEEKIGYWEIDEAKCIELKKSLALNTWFVNDISTTPAEELVSGSFDLAYSFYLNTVGSGS